ncbi:hypothetical protein CCACVL1_19250 [Corchorus capsularis]|uniref:Uncharacterized protein n=1 Tax=Corchorus capsularis TaxID=210143 RepID=A0A1R3HHL1_COCAP|nr:hypothetical protein CCACVL1_19250 [Corchorus capsularis]
MAIGKRIPCLCCAFAAQLSMA